MENKITVKKIVFKIKDKQVYAINADDVVVSDIEDLRDAIAVHYELASKEDVIFEAVDVDQNELSKTAMVGSNGSLYSRNSPNQFFSPVYSVVPTVDVKTNAGYQKFLEFVFNDDIDGAISFQ